MRLPSRLLGATSPEVGSDQATSGSGPLGLGRSAVFGVVWTVLAAIIGRFGTVIALLLLARLLTPREFGLIGMGLVVVNAMAQVTDLGLSQALVVSRHDSRTLAATASAVVLAISSAFFLGLYLAAPLAVYVFHEPEVVALIRVLAVILVAQGLASVPAALIERDLKFRQKFLPEAVPAFVYAAVAIGLAVAGAGVWSLVAGQVAYPVARAFFLWWALGINPIGRVSLTIARELVGYGKFVVGSSLARFAFLTIDSVAIGALLGPTALGLYEIALNLANLPVTHLTMFVGSVVFPVFAKLRDDASGIRLAYLATTRYVALVAIPAAFWLTVLAPATVPVVLGERWAGAATALQVLAWYAAIRSLWVTTVRIPMATGHVGKLLGLDLTVLAVAAVLLLPLLYARGIAGVALAATIAQAVGLLVLFRLANRLTGARLADVLGALRPVATLTAVLALLVAGTGLALDWQPTTLLELGVAAGLTSLVALAVVAVLEPELRTQARAILARSPASPEPCPSQAKL
ncbi:MAG: lipopolysaccharide biosynthesis protein [Chloroflexi bacterium]|nr:lipopolysaccharide biosynthesis protein [Chloroflexota bacterium]